MVEISVIGDDRSMDIGGTWIQARPCRDIKRIIIIVNTVVDVIDGDVDVVDFDVDVCNLFVNVVVMIE